MNISFLLKTQNYKEISPVVSHPKNYFFSSRWSLAHQQCAKDCSNDLFSNRIDSKRCQILQHIYQIHFKINLQRMCLVHVCQDDIVSVKNIMPIFPVC